MKALLTTALVASTAGAASAGGILIEQFDLLDHPDGNQNPPPYGLRVDDIIASGTATLSIDQLFDTTLSVFDDNGDLSINISGTLFGGAVSGGSYTSGGEAYTIDMTYSAGVTTDGDGWVVNGFDAANTGTLTRVSDNTSWTLFTTTMANKSFIFKNDGHRLDGDSSTWVGRGWVTDQSDGSDPYGGSRDWLFQGIDREIPAPGASLLAITGVALMGRRRR